MSELALAKELGSSRTPIREAIRQLVAEGLLDQSPNRGAVVVELTRQDIVDLYELREALEVYTVGKAARLPARPAELDRIQKLADEILAMKRELERSGKKNLSREQMHRVMTSDLGFHSLLIRLAANARILKVVNETRLLIRIFAMRHGGHDDKELGEIHRSHTDILRAVGDREPERAMRLLSDHIRISLRERLAEYDHWEREASLRNSIPEFFDLRSAVQSR